MKHFLSYICNVFIAVALSFCAFCSPSVLGLQADDVVPLVDDEYYPQVHKALAAAKKSISCVMFVADINPKYANGWEYNLVTDLIDAHQRGISVTVILDQNVTFWEEGGKGKELERKSREAYELLRKKGVPVYYDDKDRITHDKILVIDNYVTIVGSTNWTYSALKKNHEASVLIRSQSVAEAFLEKLKTISKCQPKY
ncbi:MAG: hypothetical protein HZB37_12060 [Planctomycetes bacterium]|nr:hypothetical protein [Planctomycetota bacterium]